LKASNVIAAHRPDSATLRTDSKRSKFRVQGSMLKWLNALNSGVERFERLERLEQSVAVERKNSLSLLPRPIKKRRKSMPVGMILLAVWLILQGLPLIVRFVIPNKLMGMLALLAGILILIGR
jgi:hypothetical protein